MDNQDHRKNHTAGHDSSHGVHVCHKCGWPFPNPHPSARHRRAHRKICGTIEGYKLVDSEGSARLTGSDDEHLSDEDHKTSSPPVLERSKNEKGSIEIGERSSKSQDEVFSDAAADFPDSGSGKGIEEFPEDIKKPAMHLETAVENDTTATLSHEDSAITANIPPPSNLADNSQLQNIEVQESNLSESAQESHDHISGATIDLVERSLTDFRIEESVPKPSDNKGGSTCDPKPIQLEAQSNSSEGNNEKTASGDSEENDTKGNEETQNDNNNTGDDFAKIDTNGNEETILDRHLLTTKVSPSDNVGEASETLARLGEIEDLTSDPAPTAGVGQLKELHNSEISLNDLSPELISVEHKNTSVGTVQVKVDDAQGMAHASSGKSTESYNANVEGNDNVYVLSVPDDIPIVENAESIIRGFKDYEGGRIPQLVDVDSFGIINDVKNSPANVSSSLLNEGTEVPVSDMHVLKDNLEQKGGSCEHVVEHFADETAPGTHQVKFTLNESQRTEEFGATSEAVAIKNEKSCTVQSLEEKLPDDYCINSSLKTSVENAEELLSDMNLAATSVDAEARRTTDIIVVDDPGDHDKGEIKTCDIAENEEHKRITEESCTENIIVTLEPPILLSELKVDARTNSFGGKNVADPDKGKVESYHVSETEPGEGNSTLGSLKGDLSVTGRMMDESVSNLHESHTTSEDVINVSERNTSEHECLHLSSVSDNQDDVKELERIGNRNGKVQVEGAYRVSAAAESNNVGENDNLQMSSTNVGDFEVLKKPSDKIDDAEVLQKSSGEYMTKEPQLSPLDTSSSIQNSAIIGDNSAKDFVAVTSENRSASSPDECENKFVAQQLGASATDFSVDSGSQTDSLEGHWGSVSVLSTQSDMPAIIDAEPLVSSKGSKVSAEAEKADLKKPKALLGRQDSDKSEIFEPPSFMTLVEPRGGDKAGASDNQTEQNVQQPKATSLQAGWFPSLTNVVNESQGRKKNEEIIAKVTNWSTGKQHSPLKNLLGEASNESKSKSPNAKDNPPPVVQKDETNLKDKVTTTTVNSILSHQMPVPEPVKKEAGKEWNSPARYPADIKREKRKVKGRPYWAQFVCCSSVN